MPWAEGPVQPAALLDPQNQEVTNPQNHVVLSGCICGNLLISNEEANTVWMLRTSLLDIYFFTLANGDSEYLIMTNYSKKATLQCFKVTDSLIPILTLSRLGKRGGTWGSGLSTDGFSRTLCGVGALKSSGFTTLP